MSEAELVKSKAPSPENPEQEKSGSSLRRRTQHSLLAVAIAGLIFAGLSIWQKRESLLVLCGLSAPEPTHFTPASQSFELSNATIPRDEILPGGPPKDGIPSLTDPKFVKASAASFLKADDCVIGVAVKLEARAYPLKILNYHEAVNDRIGGIPLAVTYCPLCDSAAVFDRRHAGEELEFGISGLLYNSNVLLFNRKKDGGESLWSQMMAESVAGPNVKQQLQALPLEVTTWGDWSSRYPKTKVLSTDTGHDSDYSTSPYGSYFASPDLMFPAKPTDDRFPLKTRVLEIWSNKTYRAYPVSEFK